MTKDKIGYNVYGHQKPKQCHVFNINILFCRLCIEDSKTQLIVIQRSLIVELVFGQVKPFFRQNGQKLP